MYVGIDVSKGYGDFVILDEKKHQQESLFQLDDNTQGHEQLKRSLKVMYSKDTKFIVVWKAPEATKTGGYNNLGIGVSNYLYK